MKRYVRRRCGTSRAWPQCVAHRQSRVLPLFTSILIVLISAMPFPAHLNAAPYPPGNCVSPGQTPTAHHPVAQPSLLMLSGHVYSGSTTGPGLRDVNILYRLAGYSGQLLATTNEDGSYRAAPIDTFGHRETVTVWPEQDPDFMFSPACYTFVYYAHGDQAQTLDFIAFPARTRTFLPLILGRP